MTDQMTDKKTSCNPASLISEDLSIDSASFITINFAGYFTCRVTTDPDPTDDPYGTSGYTMALSGEPLLDQVIHLQASAESPIRPHGVPELNKKIKHGVRVESVLFNGKPHQKLTELLQDATVKLADSPLNDSLTTPKFISHNNVIGSDDTMAFVIEPFQLEIKKTVDSDHSKTLFICGVDVLDPAHPEKSAIEFEKPQSYARRLSYSLETNSADAHQAIGVYDEYGYFRDRRQWLGEQIDSLTALIDEINITIEKLEHTSELPEEDIRELEHLCLKILETSCENCLKGLYIQGGELPVWSFYPLKNTVKVLNKTATCLETQQQNYKTRLYQLEMWGDRVINKLGFKTNWSHSINCVRTASLEGGTQVELNDLLQGEIITDQPWKIDYWFGGWDGDLLTGAMQGSLQIPFKPSTPESEN